LARGFLRNWALAYGFPRLIDTGWPASDSF
jgi:hypothetical protein